MTEFKITQQNGKKRTKQNLNHIKTETLLPQFEVKASLHFFQINPQS